jgi:hypothetical protein
MSRVFLMKWYHFSVEYFEDLRNVNHCEFLIMRKKEDSGKYILENNLRTWSELKRERLAAAKEKEKGNPSKSSELSGKDKEKEKKLASISTGGDTVASGTSSPVPVRKKWGGCPNGCDHGKNSFKKENSMHAMQLNGKPVSSPPTTSPVAGPGENLVMRRPGPRRWQSSSEEDEEDSRGRLSPSFTVDVKKGLDEASSRTPGFISIESSRKSPTGDGNGNGLAHLSLPLKAAGRDFGGSASGNTSQAGSDAESSAEEEAKKRLAKGKKSVGIESLMRRGGLGHGNVGANGKGREESGMGRGAMADALGDQSDVGSDGGSEAELEDLRAAEREDKSIRGSVY